MSPSDQISRYIAEKGVTACPTAICAGGWTPGIAIANPTTHAGSESFNVMDANPSRPNPGRDSSNASRHREYLTRQKRIIEDYRASPTVETLHLLAGKYQLGILKLARILRESGFQDVKTTHLIKRCGPSETNERRRRLMTAILEYVSEEILMPSNQHIANQLGLREFSIPDYLRYLSKDGLIKVLVKGGQRMVTVVASGKSTKCPSSMMEKK